MPRKTADPLPSVSSDSATAELFADFDNSSTMPSPTIQVVASTAGTVATLASKQSTLDKMRAEARERLEALDELSRQIASEGRDPTLIELEAYYSAGLTDQPMVRREINRAKVVLRLQAICGDGAYRARCKAELEDACKELEERGGPLREQIAELQRELNALESNARQCRDRQEKIELACSELAERLPRHLQDAYDSARRRAKLIDGQHRNRLRVRHDQLALIVDKRDARHALVIEHCKSLPASHPAYAWHERAVRDERGHVTRIRHAEVPQAAWDTLRTEYVAEFARIGPELEGLEAALEARLDQAKKLLGYYIPA